MRKKELRSHFRNKRNSFNSHLIDNYSLKIANRSLNMPIWDFSFYHIFLSISRNKEVDTGPLLSIIQGRDKNVVVPKTFSKGVLRNYLLTDSTAFKKNALGIPEPVGGIEISENQLEVVFLPLLAFDLKGNRVGYGGGYYDTFLKKCSPKTLKIGLSFFEAVNQIEDIDENDVPLDYCVTPKKIYEF
ncbi:MAG: 5-formyltetrahydrofolate cyclo-ligase [Bacteroidota bacterium]